MLSKRKLKKFSNNKLFIETCDALKYYHSDDCCSSIKGNYLSDEEEEIDQLLDELESRLIKLGIFKGLGQMTSLSQRVRWHRVWRRLDQWCKIEGFPFWRQQQKKIKQLVNKDVNWRGVWSKFNAWARKIEKNAPLHYPDWIRQKTKLQELVNEELGKKISKTKLRFLVSCGHCSLTWFTKSEEPKCYGCRKSSFIIHLDSE